MRIKFGISIEEAAKKLRISGGYLSQIEKGQRQISAERADEIANLYGVKKKIFFTYSLFSLQSYEAKEYRYLRLL